MSAGTRRNRPGRRGANTPAAKAAKLDAAMSRASGPQPTLTFGPEPQGRHGGVALAEAPRPAPSFTPASGLPAAVTGTGPMTVPHYRVWATDGPLPLAEEAAKAAEVIPEGDGKPKRTGIGPVGLNCDLCAAAFDPAAGADGGGGDALVPVDRVFLALRSAARAAGWHRGPDGFLRCPACASAWETPVIGDGKTVAEWDAEALEAFAAATEKGLREVDADLDAFAAAEVARWKAADTAALSPRPRDPRPALEAAPGEGATADGDSAAPGEPAEADGADAPAVPGAPVPGEAPESAA